MLNYIKRKIAKAKHYFKAIETDRNVTEHDRGFEWAAGCLIEHGPSKVEEIENHVIDCDQPFDRGALAAIACFQHIIYNERVDAVNQYKANMIAEVDRWANMNSLPARMDQ